MVNRCVFLFLQLKHKTIQHQQQPQKKQNTMDVINKAARSLNHSIDAVQAYLVDNGPAIACLIVVMYFIRKSFMNNSHGRGYTLSQSSGSSSVPGTAKFSTTGSTTKFSSNKSSREEEMRLVRQRQQEIATERARQAAMERKMKEEEERTRRNNVAQRKYLDGGDQVGDAAGSMNPRPKPKPKKQQHQNNGNSGNNPWSNSSNNTSSSSSSSSGFNHLLNQGGSSYRPASRRRPMS